MSFLLLFLTYRGSSIKYLTAKQPTVKLLQFLTVGQNVALLNLTGLVKFFYIRLLL